MVKKTSFLPGYCFVFFILFSATSATTCIKDYEHRLFQKEVYCVLGCCHDHCCSGIDNFGDLSESDVNRHFISLSAPEIAGIIVGCVTFFVIVVVIIRVCCVSQNRPGRVVNNVAQPSVSVVTTGMQQQMAPGMQMQMQHPPPGYIPQAQGTSAGYTGHPDTKGPPPPY